MLYYMYHKDKISKLYQKLYMVIFIKVSYVVAKDSNVTISLRGEQGKSVMIYSYGRLST